MLKLLSSTLLTTLLLITTVDLHAVEPETGLFQATVDGAKYQSRSIEEATRFQPGIMSEHISSGAITLDILNFNGVGAYELSDASTALASYNDANGIRYTTDKAHKGTVSVTYYDAIHHVLRGEVSFTAVSPSGKTVTVLDGFFRVG